MLPTAKCAACPLLFTPTRRWQRFCSTRCRKAFHQALTPEALRREIDTLKAAVAALEARVAALAAAPHKPAE